MLISPGGWKRTLPVRRGKAGGETRHKGSVVGSQPLSLTTVETTPSRESMPRFRETPLQARMRVQRQQDAIWAAEAEASNSCQEWSEWKGIDEEVVVVQKV